MTSSENGGRGVQDRVFAVVGATGQQGGATARALLEAGAGVRALTRSPGSERARALADLGATVVRADSADAASLRAAFDGADGVFAMTTPDGGVDGEVEHGAAIADAARDAGVAHLAYSSVGGAERRTGIPHFESKRRVEEHIESLGLPATFLRPVFFMDNFAGYFAPRVEDGVVVIRMPLPGGVPLQMIAGDELTGEEVAAAFGEEAGLPARYEPLPLSVLVGNGDTHAMFE